jgi:hypothetical protein
MVIKMSFWSIFSSFLSFWSDFHVLIKFTHLSQSDRSAWLSNHHFCRFSCFCHFCQIFIILAKTTKMSSFFILKYMPTVHYLQGCHKCHISLIFVILVKIHQKPSFLAFWSSSNSTTFERFFTGRKPCFGGHLSCHWHRRCTRFWVFQKMSSL